MTAYYNEYDAKTAAWLRELIRAGLVAPGDVDERSIVDVQPRDLLGYRQCHFFAGIGVWSYALRLAGWPDHRPVWTGSCPCPPFSSAGKQKPCPRCGSTNPVPHVGRTGYFVCCGCAHEWYADARHLYPEFWRLIRVGNPVTVFGEQVASLDGRTWLATVRASLEILGYAVGAADTSSAIVGAPHIRQRLYFVADAHGDGRDQARRGESASGNDGSLGDRGTGVMADADSARREVSGAERGGDGEAICARASSERTTEHGRVVGDAERARLERHERHVDDRDEPGRFGADEARPAPTTSIARELADTDVGGLGVAGDAASDRRTAHGVTHAAERRSYGRFWSDAEWIACTDGKARPVRSGTFPLAHGAPARVVRLRGYGNALVSEQARAFIEAYLDVRGG